MTGNQRNVFLRLAENKTIGGSIARMIGWETVDGNIIKLYRITE